ncbi:MAG: AAA family ATPase [Candidatus Nanoarchaeia archaeon]
MIIKKIKLYNIRSYNYTEIDLSTGITLLSGDIGSGKSSVLLAIEFALFGVKRGETTGTSLLRHGKNEGSVLLNIEVDGKDIHISRPLKRMKHGVKQDSGYIIIDGVKTQGTAEELKAKVLEILGYPQELLKKGKDLVYRFTVYTPQEQMKAILFESKDERLDTLRKVFGIDKYKKIKENTLGYITYLKSEKRNLEGKIYGFDEKIRQMKEKQKEVENFRSKREKLKPFVEDKKKNYEKAKEKLQGFENQINDLNKLKSSLEIVQAQIDEKFSSRQKSKKEIEKLSIEVKELEKEIQVPDNTDYSGLIKEKREELNRLEADYKRLSKETSECEIKIENAMKIMDKISNLEKCPTCEQNVEKSHRDEIVRRENKSIEEIRIKQKKLSLEAENVNKKISSIKKEIEDYIQNEKAQAVLKEKIKSRDEKKTRIEIYKREIDEIKKKIGELNSKKIEINKKVEGFEGISETYKGFKEEMENIEKELNELQGKLVAVETRIDEGKKNIQLYEKEIEEKKAFKEKIKNIQNLQNWMENIFLNLISLMEKSVMAQLYKEFNELFVEWFRTLIEDETLNVRLDDQFTPVIEQNGYETELQNLSGGEKTSVALAYRLSLNKVINDFITHIKTKNIIILDEPTDGFSQEQLDNVRDVIEQLNVRQVIIVSHESKVESFVDNVIRVSKSENGSLII